MPAENAETPMDLMRRIAGDPTAEDFAHHWHPEDQYEQNTYLWVQELAKLKHK